MLAGLGVGVAAEMPSGCGNSGADSGSNPEDKGQESQQPYPFGSCPHHIPAGYLPAGCLRSFGVRLLAAAFHSQLAGGRASSAPPPGRTWMRFRKPASKLAGLEFLHLQNALSPKFPALAPLGERVDRIRRLHQPVRDG